MRISQYELYDLAEVLSVIRGCIQDPLNMLIIDKLTECLEQEHIYDNAIRKSLSRIKDIDRSRFEFCFHYNYYVNLKLYQDVNATEKLKEYLKDLKNLIELKSYEQAEEFADAIHCLPEIIDNNHGVIPKDYYKYYIRPYEKKWGATGFRRKG